MKKVNLILSHGDGGGNKITNNQGMRELAKKKFVELF